MGILRFFKSSIDSLREGFQEGMQHKSVKENFDESYDEAHDKAYNFVRRAFFGEDARGHSNDEHTPEN